MFSGNIKFSDDEDLFGSGPNANNLANIFGTAMEIPEENDNVTLKYKSPKPGIIGSVKNVGESFDVSNNNSNQSSTVDWKILLAEVVFSYKLLNKENISQGKLALALLKNTEDLYKIILYRTKTNILSTTKLNQSKKIYVKSNYIQFEDDTNEFWSVTFEKSTNHDLLLKALQNITTIEYDNSQNHSKKSGDEKIQEDDNKVDTTNTKENILSRMSKLGQPILLPKPPNSTTEMSDSSDSGGNQATVPIKQVVPPRKIHHYHNKSDSTNLVPYNSANQKLIPSNSSIVMVAPQETTSSSSLNVFLSENRTQNSEIRMNLLKLDTKIDRIMDRFDTFAVSTNKNMHHDDQIIELEEKILELKKENRQIKILLGENNSKEKVEEMENRLQKSKLENGELSEKIAMHVAEMNKLNSELKTSQSNLTETSGKYSELLAKYSSLENEFDQLNKNYTQILTDKMELVEKASENENRIKSLDDELNVIKLADNTKINTTDTIVKDIINNLYHKICDQFAQKAEYQQNEIIKIIGRTIKLETNNQLKQLNKN